MRNKTTKWTFKKDKVVIEIPIVVALNLGRELNEWENLAGWINREDCQNWKRSSIARENRRESITLANCLSSIRVLLGGDKIRKLQELAKNNE